MSGVGAVEAIAVSSDRSCYLGLGKKNPWEMYQIQTRFKDSCQETTDPAREQPSPLFTRLAQKDQITRESRDLGAAQLPQGVDNRPKTPQAQALAQKEEAKQGQMALGNYNLALQNIRRSEEESKKKPDVKMSEPAAAATV